MLPGNVCIYKWVLLNITWYPGLNVIGQGEDIIIKTGKI